MYKPKKRRFFVKLESVDPTGTAIKTKELSMKIIDDENSMIKSRLVLHIDNCSYFIDLKGNIIDRI